MPSKQLFSRGNRSITTSNTAAVFTTTAATQTSPELFGKLLLGDEMSTARSTAPSAPQPSKSVRAVHSAGRASMHRAPSKGAQIGAAYDTPRGFGDEPLSVDQELAIEMESVKKERQQLMESIAQVKAEAGALAVCLRWCHQSPHVGTSCCGATSQVWAMLRNNGSWRCRVVVQLTLMHTQASAYSGPKCAHTADVPDFGMGCCCLAALTVSNLWD